MSIYHSTYETPPPKMVCLKDDDDENHDDSEEEEDVSTSNNIPKSASSLLPIISLKQGLQKKASPLALESWVKLALTLDGRDKITKVVQYSSRMLAWWFASSHQSKRFKSLQSSVTTSRKAFRLGRSFIEIHKIRESGFLQLLLRPLVDKDSTTTPTSTNNTPAWKIIGTAMKMIGLMGFWAGDNINFLSMSGCFDDWRPEIDPKDRLAKRTQLKTQAAIFANRFYFFGAVAGLITNLKVYWLFRQTTIQEAHQRLVEAIATSTKGANDELEQRVKEAKQALEKAQEKQFTLFVALLKVSHFWD